MTLKLDALRGSTQVMAFILNPLDYQADVYAADLIHHQHIRRTKTGFSLTGAGAKSRVPAPPGNLKTLG